MSIPIELLRQMPKAELHCHLDGFVRPATVVELAKQQNVQLETFDVGELAKLMCVPDNCPDLVTYLKCFKYPLLVMQIPYAITRIFYEACEDAVKDGISYLELRFAPALHTKNGYSYSQILEAAIDGAVMAERRLPIIARIICCAMRQMDPIENKKVADIAWRYRNRYVVGFDLAGPESGFPADKHIAAFRTMRENGVSLTIHAGEAFGAKSVEMAIACSANRIGHGTRAIEDETILNELIDRRIPVEMCVSCNVQTKAIPNVQSHPIRFCFDRGLICVPCTDDPTVSKVTLSGEYSLIQSTFNFNVEEIVRLMDYGFRSAFLPETMKRRLRIEAFLASISILQKHSIDISPIIANSRYYAGLGLTVPPRLLSPIRNPPMTLELIEEIPKCDLDCRLIGSIPLPVLYKFYCNTPNERKMKSIEEFKNFIFSDDALHSSAKELSLSLLQSLQNIKEGVDSLLQEAVNDRVKYMELSICPLLHTKQGLTVKQVMDTVVESKEKFNSEITVAFLISCNVKVLSPQEFQQLAELSVEYREKGVVGFVTTSQEITNSKWGAFEAPFDYLRKNHINVQIFAGEEDATSVPIALVRGGARRIAGGFKITKSDSLINDVNQHNTTVLVSLSRRMENASDDWDRSPVRSMYDFGVKVAYSSIHNSFTGKSRSAQLFDLAEQSGFDTIDLIKIIDNAFSSMFLPYAESKKFQKGFWDNCLQILGSHGFSSFVSPTFFDSK